MFPQLERIEIRPGEVLYEQWERVAYAYFPETAVMSMLTVVNEGKSIEVATVGNEGIVGLPLFLDMALARSLAQVPGAAWRISADEFRRGLRVNPTLGELVDQYTKTFVAQIALSSGCNSLHSAEQRCARWLLISHDRANCEAFTLTQQFLSEMLGISRPRLNIVLRNLQKSGFIRYERGKLMVTSRRGLERVSCECYQVIREHISKLPGATPTL